MSDLTANIPEVVKEIRVLFERYEQALVFKVRGKELTGRQSQTWVRFPDDGWKVISAHVSTVEMVRDPPHT